MSSLPFTLFSDPDQSPMRIARTGYQLRDFQSEDVDAAMSAIEAGNRAVLAVAATGLGKSVMLSELALRLSSTHRVLTTVDVGTLAGDLARSISHHTGEPCGVLTGDVKSNLDARIIASTIQTLYAKGKDGRKRYEWAFDVTKPWALLVDECESAIAKEFHGVCKHFLAGNPANVLVGTTATPMRGDKRGLSELFDYAHNEPGPLNRNIVWACDNGWLVRPRQAFVHVNLDFSTLKVSKNANGERDYKDEDLGKLLSDEQALREFAIGIHKLAAGEPSIVIVPTIDVAEKLSHHLCSVAESAGAAHAVSSRNKAHSLQLIERFKRGEFPYIISVAMLYKGFDADRIRYVFMGRKTQSQRIYSQAMGRGTRPLKEIRDALADAPDAAARLAIIAASEKPVMTVVDLVGIKPSVKDVSVIDVLGSAMPLEVVERAKRKMLESAVDGESVDAEQAARDAQKELADIEVKRMAHERRKRELIQVDGQVAVEFSDSFGGSMSQPLTKNSPSQRIITSMKRAGVSDAEIARMTPEMMKRVNGMIQHHWKNKLVSWKQAKHLKRYGYTKEQLAVMPYKEATAILDAKWGKRKMVTG